MSQQRKMIVSRNLSRFGILCLLCLTFFRPKRPLPPSNAAVSTAVFGHQVGHQQVHQEYKVDGLCSLVTTKLVLGASLPTASAWWSTHLKDILRASHHFVVDPTFAHQTWMAQLLRSLTPYMLQQGIRSLPLPKVVEPLAQLLRQRWLNDGNSSKPIQIAVLGGSVTQGRGCEILPASLAPSGYAPHKDKGCAWAALLELVINQWAGMQLVQVHNLAVGGTDSTVATPVVKYWLYPKKLLPGGPDIIISAYGTNEAFVGANHTDTTQSTQFANKRRERVQAFIQAVIHARPCDATPPLVVFLDDYLGNQQDYILGETTYNKVVTEMADWYGNVLHVSAADVVRRWVYADTDAALFNAQWTRQGTEMAVNVHFGMVGHVTIAWALSFGFLVTLASYCQDEAFQLATQKFSNQSSLIDESVAKLVNNVPPPPLNKDATLTNITRDWKAVEEERRINQQLHCDLDSDDNFSKPPCSFAFMAGPAGTVRSPNQLRLYMDKFLQANNGWKPLNDYNAGGYARKLGWVATVAGASCTLQLTQLAKEVRILNLQTLKSYGEKWANSTARFTLTVANPGHVPITHSFDIEGYHDSQASISYPFEYDLGNGKALKNSSLTLKVDLIGGTTFKIIAMMLCSR